MMDTDLINRIDDIIEERPYLGDVLNFYKKVIEFKGILYDIYKMPISFGDWSYPAEIITPIFKSFSSIFDIPEESIEPLKEAIKFNKIDFTKLPLNDVSEHDFSYDAFSNSEDDTNMLLFFISKPFFLWLKDLRNPGEIFWENGKCPVCKSTPSFSFNMGEEGRMLYCSYCESRGWWNRIGCPNCENNSADKIITLEFEKEEGFKLNLCNECSSYVKTAERRLLDDYPPDILDIISLPLDIVAQNRGYQRLSPNPMGMRKMAL
jgi:FdhE protein